MTETKLYQVNYLLSMSRMPDHFYAMVNSLQGRDTEYKNPGVSLRSYLVAKCLRQETVYISGELLDTIIECEEFSTNSKVLSTIVGTLIRKAEDLKSKFATLTPKLHGYFAHFSKPLSDRAHAIKLIFDAFIMTSDPTKDHVDIMSPQAIVLKTEMFELQELISTLTYELSEALAPPPPSKA
jgi:hypothetical protein